MSSSDAHRAPNARHAARAERATRCGTDAVDCVNGRLSPQMREAFTEIERAVGHASEYSGHPATVAKSSQSAAAALRACRNARVPAEPLSRIAAAAATSTLTVRRRLLNDARNWFYEHHSQPEQS